MRVATACPQQVVRGELLGWGGWGVGEWWGTTEMEERLSCRCGMQGREGVSAQNRLFQLEVGVGQGSQGPTG